MIYKLHSFLFLFFFISILSFGQSNYVASFNRTYYANSWNKITETPQGNYLIAGTKIYVINDIETWVPCITELTKEGEVVFERFYRIEGRNGYGIKALKNTIGETYLIVHTDQPGIHNHEEMIILKLNSNGNIIWSKKAHNTDHPRIIASNMEFNSNSELLITGCMDDTYPFFIKIDAQGNQVYGFKIDAFDGVATQVFETGIEDEYIICGYGFIAKTSGNTLEYINRFYSPANISSEYFYIKDSISSGYYLATCAYEQDGTWFPAIAKLDEFGNVEWSKYYKNNWVVGEVFGLAMLNDKLYISIEPEFGTINGIWHGSKAGVMTFDLSGNLINTNIFEWDRYTFPSDIISTSEKQLVTLYSSSPLLLPKPDGRYTVLKYDPNNFTQCMDETLIAVDENILELYATQTNGYIPIDFIVNATVTKFNDTLASSFFCLDSIPNQNIGINEFLAMNENNKVKAYPNPAQNEIVFETNGSFMFEDATLEITDVIGKKLARVENINGTIKKYNIEAFNSGVYFFRFSNRNSDLSTGRFVKL